MWAPLLSLALAAPLAAAADALPHLTGKESNFTLSDMSPMLVYAPSASGPADTAWNQTYSGISWSDYSPFFPVDSENGVVPTSAHTTRFAGATVSLPFLGTAVYFYGSAKGSVDFELGGKTSQVSLDVQDGLIASATGLENVMQNAVLKLVDGTLSVTSVVVTVQLGGQGAVIANETFNAYGEDATSYFNSPNITWSAEKGRDWVPNATVCGEYKNARGEGSSCWSNPRIQTNVPQASFILRPPANTSFLALYTISNSEQGPFTVTVDPPLFDGPATTSYTQNNAWLAQRNVVMYFTPLDFRKSYNVSVTFTGNAEQYLEFRYGRTITTVGGDMTQPGVSPNDSTNGSGTGGSKAGADKSSVPLGAIIGAAVGGGVALLLIALLIFFCCRRRRQRSNIHAAPLGDKRGGKRGARFRRPPSGLSNFEEDAADPDKDVFVIDSDDSGASVTPLGAVGSSAARSDTSANRPQNQNIMSPAAIAKAQEAGMETRYASTPYATPPAAYPSTGSYPSERSGSQSFSAQPSTPSYPGSSGSGSGRGGYLPQSASTPLSGPDSPMSYQQHYPPFVPPQYDSHPQPLHQQAYQQPGGFYVANASHLGSPTTPVSPHSPVGALRPSRQGSTPLAPLPHHPAVKEEVDAGRVPGSRARPQETVPPRYNPMWAEEDDSHAL